MASLTYDQLRTRVAEYMGIDFKGTDGTEKSQLSTNAHDLDLLGRIVNDGYERFIMEREWAFLNPLAELTFKTATSGSIETGGTGTFTDTDRTEAAGTFAGDSIKIIATDGSSTHHIILNSTAAGVFTFADSNLVFTAGDEYSIVSAPAIRGEEHRYRMPEDFIGVLKGRMTYAGPAGTPRLEIKEVSDENIRLLNAGQTTTGGDPVLVAFRPLTQDDPSDEPTYEAVFWPSPSANRTVVFRYRREPAALSLGTDRPICGAAHSRTLLAAIKAEAELQRFDKAGPEEEKYQKFLTLSKGIDRETQPRSLGIMTENSDHMPVRPFVSGTVDTVGGQSITF